MMPRPARKLRATNRAAAPSFPAGPTKATVTGDEPIHRFMTAAPRCIGRDQKLDMAHRLMRTYSLRHLPVLQGGKLVGLLSQRDLYFLETIRGVDPEKDVVEDGMTTDIFQVGLDAPLRKVVETMAKKKVGSAVVVDDDDKVAGVFTTTDALDVLSSILRARGPS